MTLADPTTTTRPSCENVLVKCDRALQDKVKQVEARDKLIAQSSDVIQKQSGVIVDQEAKLSAWYRNPAVLILIGVVGGFVASQRLGK
jgi:hypothetical protein